MLNRRHLEHVRLELFQLGHLRLDEESLNRRLFDQSSCFLKLGVGVADRVSYSLALLESRSAGLMASNTRLLIQRRGRMLNAVIAVAGNTFGKFPLLLGAGVHAFKKIFLLIDVAFPAGG